MEWGGKEKRKWKEGETGGRREGGEWNYKRKTKKMRGREGGRRGKSKEKEVTRRKGKEKAVGREGGENELGEESG